jgi:hypothetical protein
MRKEKVIAGAVATYNKYHGKEAMARLIKTSPTSLIVEFNGPYCRSCCPDKYFVDFQGDLEDAGIKSKIQHVQRKGEDKFLVEFVLKTWNVSN